MRDATRSIQTGLAGLGYDPGPLDGWFGDKTDAAARAWLEARGRASGPPVPPGVPVAPITTAMIHQGAARYPVREIIVHCSATRPEWMAGRPLAEKVAEIRRWHMQDRGWKDIGYHWIIDRPGGVMHGRPETVIGAHTADNNKNRGTLGICLIGGHGSAATDAFAAHFTVQQDLTLRQMISAISLRTAIDRVTGHNDHTAAKACPGFKVAPWFKGSPQ